MATFKPIYSEDENNILRENEDGTITYIPKSESNSDYQAYLASLDEQQAALEAKLTK